MARISLLLSLAFVLAITTVSAHHPNHKKPQKISCPPTLSGLQTFPYTEISKLIVKKLESSPNTIQFNTLFDICKSYNDFLGGFKVAFAKDVAKSLRAKYGSTTKAMLDAQAATGVEGELAFLLMMSYSEMSDGFIKILHTIAKTSAKYKFDPNARIRKCDRIRIDRYLVKLKSSIKGFVKVVTKCSKKFTVMKKASFNPNLGGFVGIGFDRKLSSLGRHGQVKAGVKVGAHGGGKIIAHSGGKAGAKVGAKGRARAGGNIGGLFSKFFGLGGKAQFDAAGKAKINGGDGFRSLNHPSKKHLD